MSQEAAAAVDERQTKSLISELPSEVSSAALREADKTPEEPECVIIQEPKTGYPEFLVAEVKLPKVVSLIFVFLFGSPFLQDYKTRLRILFDV